MLNNTAFGRKGASKTPAHFHPLAQRTKRMSRQESISVLHGFAGVNVKQPVVRQSSY
jgi:hypothetical protein